MKIEECPQDNLEQWMNEDFSTDKVALWFIKGKVMSVLFCFKFLMPMLEFVQMKSSLSLDDGTKPLLPAPEEGLAGLAWRSQVVPFGFGKSLLV